MVTKIQGSGIDTDTITAGNIAAGAVGASEIATDGVGSAEIAADAVGAAEIAAGAVGTSEIEDGAITHADVAAGFSVQTVAEIGSALVTGTTVLPDDDSVPQSGEGVSVFSGTGITPKSATNKLRIDVVVNAKVSGGGAFPPSA